MKKQKGSTKKDIKQELGAIAMNHLSDAMALIEINYSRKLEDETGFQEILGSEEFKKDFKKLADEIFKASMKFYHS